MYEIIPPNVKEIKPVRIQRKRTKGWRMPPNTVYVGRPSGWGNPFNWRDEVNPNFGDGIAKALCKIRFHDWLKDELANVSYLEDRRQWILTHLPELHRKNLACWCPRGWPCHSDVLLELANEK